jgi:hypothetical protein
MAIAIIFFMFYLSQRRCSAGICRRDTQGVAAAAAAAAGRGIECVLR